ncbi:hypothetical protein D3C72_2130070 [compost metagenome]
MNEESCLRRSTLAFPVDFKIKFPGYGDPILFTFESGTFVKRLVQFDHFTKSNFKTMVRVFETK